MEVMARGEGLCESNVESEDAACETSSVDSCVTHKVEPARER